MARQPSKAEWDSAIRRARDDNRQVVDGLAQHDVGGGRLVVVEREQPVLLAERAKHCEREQQRFHARAALRSWLDRRPTTFWRRMWIALRWKWNDLKEKLRPHTQRVRSGRVRR